DVVKLGASLGTTLAFGLPGIEGAAVRAELRAAQAALANQTAQAATSRTGTLGAKLASEVRKLTFEEENRRLLYDLARNMLEQLDPQSQMLQTLHPLDRIPSIGDIKALNREAEVLRARHGFKIDEHHHFPREFDAARFSKVGINPDDYTTYMWTKDH